MNKRKIAFLALSLALLISVLGGAVFGQATQKNSVYRYLSIFTEVFDLVRTNYVEQATSEQLLDGAFSGVTDAVDEFSYYVPPAQMAAYKGFVDSEDVGLGLVVSRRFGYGYVIAAVPGSPAAKAGIERGDFIEKIDGKSTTKMAAWQMKTALTGGRPVQLNVLRAGQTKREEIRIEPAAFHPVSISTRQVGDVAVISVPYFDKGVATQFRAALEQARKAGTKKAIVDVRGNAGGDVEEAVAAADELLTSGLITGTQGGKADPKKQWQADRNTAFDGEVLVLTDNSTAAAGEIFASAIHGNGRGKTVGATTYGKAVVQKFITLPSGGGVYMTVAHYTTPDGKRIKEAGVRPDVAVDLTADALRDRTEKSQQRPDLILEKALSLFGQTAAAAKKAA